MNNDHQRVGIALDLLSEGIFPFFEQELRAVYGDRWEETARSGFRGQTTAQSAAFHWDAQAILTVMWNTWNSVFQRNLGIIERSLVSELREFRNRWAHQTSFTEDDAYRVLDSVQRLLISCDAVEAASRVEKHKFDLLREKLGKRVNQDLARVRFNRNRIIDATLYSICGIAIGLMMIFVMGERHPMSSGFVVGFTLFAFSYLIYKRFQESQPVYGVHECVKCRKVVYTEVCPYCDPVTRSPSGNKPQNRSSMNLLSLGKQSVMKLMKRRSPKSEKV